MRYRVYFYEDGNMEPFHRLDYESPPTIPPRGSQIVVTKPREEGSGTPYRLVDVVVWFGRRTNDVGFFLRIDEIRDEEDFDFWGDGGEDPERDHAEVPKTDVKTEGLIGEDHEPGETHDGHDRPAHRPRGPGKA